MTKGINPIRKEKVKQALLQGKSQAQALLAGGNKKSTAYHRVRANNTLLNVVKQEILDEFKLSSVNVEYVIKNLKEHAEQSLKPADRIRALELLGKYLELFTDKQKVEKEPDKIIISFDKNSNTNRLEQGTKLT